MSSYEPPTTPPPPPPGDGYGAPPPPPGGGYGAPPPAGGGYGAPPSQPPRWDLGAAVSYGWQKFQANAGAMIGASVVLLVGAIILGGIGGVIQALATSNGECRLNSSGALVCTEGTGFFVRMILSALVSALIVIAYQIVGAGLIRASLKVTQGGRFEFGEVLKFDNLGNVLGTALLIAAGTFVGTILCYLPGLIFGFVSSYAMYYVVDKGQSPVQAITSSFELVKNNLGNTLVWAIISALIGVAGACLCGVGLLVAIPITMLGTAYTYKVLNGEPVAA